MNSDLKMGIMALSENDRLTAFAKARDKYKARRLSWVLFLCSETRVNYSNGLDLLDGLGRKGSNDQNQKEPVRGQEKQF